MSNSEKYFCYNPFTGIDISSVGRIRPCCKFDYTQMPYFHIKDGIKSYQSSAWLKQLKYEFIQGKKPDGCRRCWQEEDAGIESKRQHDYKRFKPQLDNLSLREKDFLLVGIAFNNLCNLACRICGPWASTTWVSELKKAGSDKPGAFYDWHTVSSHIDDLYHHTNNAVLLDIVGGEPFLNDFDEHIEFLSRFVESGHAENTIIHYTTNCTVFPDNRYLKLWKSFKAIYMQLSIDDIEHRFEYNRWPAKWSTAYSNIKKFQELEASSTNVELSIAYTVSAFTILYANEFVEWCASEKLPEPWFGLVAQYPQYHPAVLDEDTKQLVKNTLANSKSENVKNLINYLTVKESDVKLFMDSVHQLDNIRNQSFTDTFPELYKGIQNKLKFL